MVSDTIRRASGAGVGAPVESPAVTEPDRPPTDGHRAFHAAVVARVDSDRAGSDFPADALAEIDTALRRRTARSPGTNLASHLRAFDMAAEVDVAPPVEIGRAHV